MYSITAVCRLTGLNSSTIRTWERRYGIPSVVRAGNGRRLYTDDQVQYLKAIGKLVAEGHAISDLADRTLEQLAEATAKPSLSERRSPYHEGALAFLQTNDLIGFRRLMSDALAFLPPSEAVSSVISPLLRDLGEGWEAGSLSIFQEHMATAVIKQLILTAAAARGSPHAGRARRALFTTLEGENHELGLLCAWYIAKAANVDAIYLGPNLPTAEIESAARAFKADIVVIACTASGNAAASCILKDLQAKLTSQSTLWIGAPANHPVQAALAGTGIGVFSTFEAFELSLCAA